MKSTIDWKSVSRQLLEGEGWVYPFASPLDAPHVVTVALRVTLGRWHKAPSGKELRGALWDMRGARGVQRERCAVRLRKMEGNEFVLEVGAWTHADVTKRGTR